MPYSMNTTQSLLPAVIVSKLVSFLLTHWQPGEILSMKLLSTVSQSHISPPPSPNMKPRKYWKEMLCTSSSNWILPSCQPHRVTSGQSNSGHKQIHIFKLFSHIYISTLCQVNLQNQSLRKHKTYIHKHQTQIFEELAPSILPLLKEQRRLGHAGIVDQCVYL